MRDKFSYRLLNADEIGLIQKIGRATYEPYYPHIWKSGGLEWYMDHCFGAEVLSEELMDPNVQYWMVEDDNAEWVGLIKILRNKPTPAFPPSYPAISNALYLEKIYLMPAFFGKGAGQYLIGFVKNLAAELGRSAIWLQVMKNGPVWAYERAGFKTVGEVYWNFELLKEEERGGWVMIYTIIGT